MTTIKIIVKNRETFKTETAIFEYKSGTLSGHNFDAVMFAIEFAINNHANNEYKDGAIRAHIEETR